jgi:predicted transcriptional regulator
VRKALKEKSTFFVFFINVFVTSLLFLQASLYDNDIELKPWLVLNKKVRLFHFLQKRLVETKHVLLNDVRDQNFNRTSEVYGAKTSEV